MGFLSSPHGPPRPTADAGAAGPAGGDMAVWRESLEATFRHHFRWSRGGWRPGGSRGAAVLSPPGWRALVAEIEQLHAAYTRGEGEFAQARNPLRKRLGGYQFYFLPRNLWRVRHVLAHLPWNPEAGDTPAAAWIGGGTLRVLDLGCGSGAFTLAVLAWLASQRGGQPGVAAVEAELVDQGHELLGLAEANIRELARVALPGMPVRLRRHAAGVERFLERGEAAPVHLAGGAMMLNEVGLLEPGRGSARAARLVSRARRLLHPGGVLLFVEAGTRKGYLHLMAVREQVLERPMLYPCPHNRACPMFDPRARRWCHATVRLPRPFFFDRELREQGGLRLGMQTLNLAGLAVQEVPDPQPRPPFARAEGSRVVSDPMPAQRPGAAGSRVVLLCTPQGRLAEVQGERLAPPTRGRWWWPGPRRQSPAAPPRRKRRR